MRFGTQRFTSSFSAFGLILAALVQPASATLITGTGSYSGTPGFDRNMEATTYCGNNPESWVRGSASLNTDTGLLAIYAELETDSVLAGPRGKVEVTVLNASGQTLATATTDEIGMGGKPPGHYVMRAFQKGVTVPQAVAQQATALHVDALCTGSTTSLFGVISPGDVIEAVKLVVTAAAAGGGGE